MGGTQRGARGRSREAAGRVFGFVQFEFGFLLGPADGRYLLRPEERAPPERVIVLRTLGAPEGRLLGRKRVRPVEGAEPEPVPTVRATLIRADPFAAAGEAEAWLDRLRHHRDALDEECLAGARVLNALMRAHRAAAADPWARDVSPAQALAVRVGYGDGDQVADGRFASALEVPHEPRRATRAERIAPQERLAAVLAARAEQLVCEELVLRARADVEAERPREAALEARVALEAAIAELEPDTIGAGAGAALAGHRAAIGEAANAALRGDPSAELQAAVAEAVTALERAIRRHRAACSGS